jgi:hypothetical protein
MKSVDYVFDPPLFLIILGSALTYLCIGGFTWGLTPERWNNPYNFPAKHVTSIFWPATLAGYIIYRIATFGPRLIKTLRERNKIPRAEIHQ